MGSSYEECRAECVGLYLCLSNDVLRFAIIASFLYITMLLSLTRDIFRIFGHDGEGAENIKYVNWLLMVRGGLLGLEFFTPETNSWKQVNTNISNQHLLLIITKEYYYNLFTIRHICRHASLLCVY